MQYSHEERIVSCKECETEFEVNRIGQAFCSRRCRNRYNNRRHKLSKEGTIAIDKVLHRNREILAQRVGEQVAIDELKAAGFSFTYFTSIVKRDNVNYHFCYEYIYQFTSKQEVMIYQSSKNN